MHLALQKAVLILKKEKEENHTKNDQMTQILSHSYKNKE
jgi:hypothetical protein